MMKNKDKKIRFAWDIHWKCNYRCPYCWWHGRWEEVEKRSVYPGWEVLSDYWKRIGERYGEVHVEINGGEPFRYPDFGKLLDRFLEIHTAGIMTNLSSAADMILSGLSPEKKNRVKIGASFHPLFADFEEFLKNAKRVKESGVALGVLYLSYPPQIKKIPEFKKRFEDAGINFSVLTFWGDFEGKPYPQSYTSEELLLIDPALGERSGKKFQKEPLVTKGKMCLAGHTYGIIHPDGEVVRCGGGSWKAENIIIGNIFSEDFKLWDEPRPCHSDHCPCNEWAFLLLER